MKNEDKAGKFYWNKTSRNIAVELQKFSPKNGVRGFAKRRWHDLFKHVISFIQPSKSKLLLELGCGGSAYLPYFFKEFGLNVYGIDYSDSGCELAVNMCNKYQVPANVTCANFFEPPVELLGKFDIVVSFGVVEHFTDTTSTISSFAKLLRPNGILFSVVPNMHGIVGFFQKIIAPDVFDVHEKIDISRIKNAHENAGLEVIESKYFLFCNFGVINPGEKPNLFKKILFKMLRIITGIIWFIEHNIVSLPANKMSSPYLICIARK